MDQPQHHAGLTQSLLVDCSVQINYRALCACEMPLFFLFRNTIWGRRSTPMACVCAIGPLKQAMWERGKRKLNIELHPVLPLWSLLWPRVFVCFCWHVSERNNAVPHRRCTTLVVGLKTALEKRRGRVVFMSLTSQWVPFLQTVCGKNLWCTQTHHSFVLRHYNTPAAKGRHRRLEKKKGWGGRLEGGIDWTEELFSMRSDDDRGRHWRALTIQMIMLLLPKSNKGSNLHG